MTTRTQTADVETAREQDGFLTCFQAEIDNALVTLTFMDSATLAQAGVYMAEALATARDLWQTTKRKEVAQRQQLERAQCLCMVCGRTWAGNDLAPKGTITERVCGLCAKAQAPAAPVAAPVVSQSFTQLTQTILDGVYTVAMPEGPEVTIKIKTQAQDAKFKPGQIIASELTGADHWRNYHYFAALETSNRVSHISQSASPRAVSALTILLSSKERVLKAAESYGKRFGRCSICGRTLSNPVSVAEGMGPICSGRLNAL